MGSRSERALGAASSGSRGREVAGIVLLGLAIFVGLSVASLQLGDGHADGAVRRHRRARRLRAGRRRRLPAGRSGSASRRCAACRASRCASSRSASGPRSAPGVSFAMLLHLALGAHRLRGHSPGGALGEYGAELLVPFVGRVGAVARRRRAAGRVAGAVDVAVVPRLPVAAGAGRRRHGRARQGRARRGHAQHRAHLPRARRRRRRGRGRGARRRQRREAGEEAARQEGRGRHRRRSPTPTSTRPTSSPPRRRSTRWRR